MYVSFRCWNLDSGHLASKILVARWDEAKESMMSFRGGFEEREML